MPPYLEKGGEPIYLFVFRKLDEVFPESSTDNGQPNQGIHLSLPKSGLRFSKKALRPSLASSVP